MLLFKHLRKKKKPIGIVAGMAAVALVLAGVLPNVFASTAYYIADAEVELDGVNDGSVTISFNSPVADEIASVYGNFDTLIGYDMEHVYFTLTSMSPGGDLSPSGVQNNTVADGLISWFDWTTPAQVAERGQLWSATYLVDKDVPAGDHTICLRSAWVASESEEWETANLGNVCGRIIVTRNEEPGTKPNQVVTFRDGDGNEIGAEGITKYFGDEEFTVTKEVTTGDGAILEYHPDDDGTGSIAHTVPDSDLVGVGIPGDVEICAWVEETANYAETRACYEVHVLKRPLDISSVNIEDKFFDGTYDATVTSVNFEDRGLDDHEYTATASFDEFNAGENRTVHVTVNLVGSAADNYVLNANNYDTTKTILPYRLIRDNVELLGSGTYSYSADGVEPEVRVKAPGVYGGTYTLVDGDDYEVVYTDNEAVGTGHLTVTGIGNFTTADVPVTIDFTIEPRGINSSNLIAPNTIVEERILSADDISINVDGVDLVRCEVDGATNCDYVLAISGNTGIAGDIVNVMAEGRNNYTGVAGKDINIVAKFEQTVAFDGISGDVEKVYGDGNFAYTATTDGDGTISYISSNTSVATVNSGSGLVTIVGVGEANIIATASETDTYADGLASYHLVVTKKTITVDSVTVSNKTYDGTTVATVTDAALSDNDLLLGDGFSIDDAYFLDDSVGDYDDVYVRIRLDDDAYELYQFNGGSNTAEVAGSARITPFTLSADNTTSELSVSEFTYNGEAKEPTVSVAVDFNGDGVKETNLVAGTDYTISYGNNVNAGNATATITGTGNYTGSLPVLDFTIYAASVENVTVTAPAQTYTGSALEPVPTVTGTVNGEPMTFTTDDYYVIEHSDFVNAGDYTFGAASGYSSNYYIPITNGTFTISKADSGEPENVPSDLAGEIDQTLADLGDLPEGFSWVDDSTVITTGMNEYEATYTKNGDTDNYNAVSLTISVLGYTGEYEVVVGAGQEYVISESGSAIFEIDADYELFRDGGKVYIDNVLVSSENYDSWSSSTVIEFKKEYMDGLALGEHTLAVLFNDGGVARATFTITNPAAPAEGESGAEDESATTDEPAAADTGVFTGVTGGAIATGITAVAVTILVSAAYVAKRKN